MRHFHVGTILPSATGHAGDRIDGSLHQQTPYSQAGKCGGTRRFLSALAALPLFAAAFGATAQSTPPTIDCGSSAAIFDTAYNFATGGTITPGVGVTDPHWQASADGVNWTPAAVQGRRAAVWAISPFGNADWISSPFTPPNNSPIYYRYQFNLDPSFPLTNFSLQFSFFVDDTLQKVTVNGTTAIDLTGGNPNAGGGGYTQASGTSLVINPGNWVSGMNTLLVQTHNVTPPSGLMVQATSNTTCPAHVGISKNADRTTPLNAGDLLTYTVIVNNTGTGVAPTASNVVVSDPLAAGIASGTWTCVQTGTATATANCPASGTLPLSETIASLPADSGLTYTINATVVATNVPAVITNTAKVALQRGDLCADGSAPPCSAAATNRQVGSIVITKTVVGAAAPGPWQFALSTNTAGCSIPAGSATAATADGSGGTATFANLPAASTTTSPVTACTYAVAEIAQPGWVMNGANSSSLTGITPPPAGTGALRVENDQQIGAIVVTKTLNGLASATPWQFGLTSTTAGCNIPAGTSPATTPSGATATSATFGALPVYSSTTPDTVCNYTVSETAQAGYLQNGGSVTGLVVTANGSTAVSIVNDQLFGSLQISKSVNGGPAAYSGAFPITVACIFNGTAVTPAEGNTQSITAGTGSAGTASFTHLPQGSLCNVSEGALPTAPTSYSWATPVIVQPASIGATAATASVTNQLSQQFGTLSVTKTVNGGPSGYSAVFQITIACTLGGNAVTPQEGNSQSITAGTGSAGTATFTHLPQGSLCNVSEGALPTAPTSYSWATPVIVQPASIGATAATASVTNQLSQQFGTLNVTKTVNGGPSGYSAAFQISVACTLGGSAVTPVEGNSLTVSYAGSAVDATFTQLPQGAICTVSEGALPTPPTSFAWSNQAIVQPAAIGPTAATASVSDDLVQQFGGLNVTKTLSGGPAGYSAAFLIDIACSLDGNPVAATEGNSASVQATATAPGTATFTGLPQGAVCSVSEGALPAAPTGYIWSTPAVTQPSGAIAAAIVSAAIANALAPQEQIVPAPVSVPTISRGMLVLLGLLALAGGIVHLRRVRS